MLIRGRNGHFKRRVRIVVVLALQVVDVAWTHAATYTVASVTRHDHGGLVGRVNAHCRIRHLQHVPIARMAERALELLATLAALELHVASRLQRANERAQILIPGRRWRLADDLAVELGLYLGGLTR